MIRFKVNLINKFCSEVKMKKLKIFFFVLSMIIVINYVAVIKFSPYEKFKQIKERVRTILSKINKISLNTEIKQVHDCTDKIAFSQNKENEIDHSFNQNFNEKKNN